MSQDEKIEDAPLDEALRRHYGERTLSESSVERTIADGKAAVRRRWRPVWMTGAAAALLLVAGATLQHQQRAELRTAVLTEIAMNHRKNLRSEVVAHDYAEIASALDRIEFALAPSRPIPDAELVGARYCSIQGQLAALLQLEVDGRRHTLYVTPASDRLDEVSPAEATHEGVAIRLWTEEDRLFALAADADR